MPSTMHLVSAKIDEDLKRGYTNALLDLVLGGILTDDGRQRLNGARVSIRGSCRVFFKRYLARSPAYVDAEVPIRRD